MEFNGEFEKLFRLVERTAANVFLTGKAGTGKTTFLKYLRQHSAKRMVVAAPTGVAAINAGGVTLHSLFQLPFEPFIPNSIRKEGNFRFSRNKLNIIRSLDLLVIDEISMVRADVLDAVDETLRRIRRCHSPFGGVQLLLIGDLQQLPPVLKSQEEVLLRDFYPTSYFFESLALKNAGFSTVELTKIYRQSDSVFVELLNKVRNNNANARDLALLNARYNPDFNPSASEGYIRLTTHNAKANQVNENKLAELPGQTFSYTATVKDDFPEWSYPTEKELVLKKGAQVMFVKNDPSPERAFFNGKIGIVSSLSSEHITVLFPDGGEVDAPRLVWNNVHYEMNDDTKAIEEKVIGSFSQFPLRLAWAITIHKSQGLTFDKVMLDANSAFAHGQVYVALSRCRSLDGLVLTSPLSPDAIKTDQRVLDFSEEAGKQVVTNAQLGDMEQAYYERLLLEQFTFSELNGTLLSISRMVSEYFSQAYLPLLHEVKRVQNDFLQDVVEVSQKFQNQLSDYSRRRDPRLQERITKASAYFLEKLGQMLPPLQEKLKVQVSRKEAKARYAALCEDLDTQLKEKMLTLQQSVSDFSIEAYLENKALAHIDDETQEKTGRRRRSRERTGHGEKRVATAQLTYDMYCSGKTPQQIAEERGLAVNTVIGHLANYVRSGQLPASELVAAENYNLLKDYFDTHPDVSGMKEVYDAFDGKCSYDEIRIMMAIPK